MVASKYTGDEIVRRGQAIYDDKLRATLEPGNQGKFLIINIDTGEYELDADDLTASKRAKARFPAGTLYAMRIGFPSAYHLGGHFVVTPRS